MPKGLDDNKFPWTSNKRYKENCKHSYVVHAEVNAILNSNRSVKGCSMYVTLFPCNECAKMIVQAGIKEIIFDERKCNANENIAHIILKTAGVKIRML